MSITPACSLAQRKPGENHALHKWPRALYIHTEVLSSVGNNPPNELNTTAHTSSGYKPLSSIIPVPQGLDHTVPAPEEVTAFVQTVPSVSLKALPWPLPFKSWQRSHFQGEAFLGCRGWAQPTAHFHTVCTDAFNRHRISGYLFNADLPYESWTPQDSLPSCYYIPTGCTKPSKHLHTRCPCEWLSHLSYFILRNNYLQAVNTKMGI